MQFWPLKDFWKKMGPRFELLAHDYKVDKVHIFWEGHKNLRNLPLTFDCMYCCQKLGEDFAKFCGLLRIYELYFKMTLHNYDLGICFNTFKKYGYSVTYFYKILLWYVKSTFDISRNTKRLFLSFCQLSGNIISFPHSSAPRISNFKYLFGDYVSTDPTFPNFNSKNWTDKCDNYLS